MPKMTGGKAIMESVFQHGVDTVFGLPGGQTYQLFDAMHPYQESGKLKVINSRHEQGVAYMAYGYAKSTGKVGVYSVVPGPGVLNTTAALCTAYGANTPVLCLTGEVPSQGIGSGIGFLHEINDQLGILQRLTKWSAHIDHPSQAPQLVNEAFRQLTSGRPRPVALQMAMDTMAMEAPVNLIPPCETEECLEPDPDLIEKAAKILGKAKRPLIMIGGGTLDAGTELLELAQALQAPIVSHRHGKGVIDDRHPLSQTYPAGHRLWADADVVLAVGTRLKYPLMYWGVDSDLQVIRIDIDPTEINRILDANVGIVADAKHALSSLIPAVARHNSVRESRQDELITLKSHMRAEFEQAVLPQLQILDVIREELPEDGYFVDEITQVGYVSWYGFPMYQPRHFISSGYQGNLGFGYATALGVQAAHPDKKVVVLGGDGGFMYQVQELATAVKYGLNPVVIVFNNSAYGNVKRDQQINYNGHIVGSELQNPDFVKLAESFGAAGYRATNPKELRTALREAFAQNSPALIEMPVDDLPSPWKFIGMPRART